MIALLYGAVYYRSVGGLTWVHPSDVPPLTLLHGMIQDTNIGDFMSSYWLEAVDTAERWLELGDFNWV